MIKAYAEMIKDISYKDKEKMCEHLDIIIEEIKSAESIVILTHENPDGDAIGSSLAMYNGLKQIGKKVDIIIPEYPKVL